METRAPRAEESAVIAALVMESDCGLLTALFGPETERLIAWLQARPRNPYSADHTLVLAEPGGTVVGAAVGSVAAAARRESFGTAVALLRWYGPALAARLPGLARAGRATVSLAAADYYLSHIAVIEARRGQGAGAELLRAAARRAQLLGAHRVVLDVEDANAPARAFYARMGYEQVSAVRIDLGRRGAFSFLRLARAV
jgi:ribosomal protein S18 acetylase RimI-like enzyme